jgi:DNA-binding transcriptional LysR family regulator
MTFNQIKIFLTVAEQMNFTNASEELFLSQSSVSKQIRKLEVELDTTLFIRKKTGIELTEAGRILLKSALNLDNEIREMKKKIVPYTKSHKESLLVFGESTLASYGIEDFMKAFPSRDKPLRVQYYERPCNEMLDILRWQKADLLLVWEENFKLNGGRTIRLLEDEAVLVVHKGHRLAGRSIIDVSALKGERFNILHQTMMRSLTLDLCRMGGFFPDICYEVKNAASQLELIAQGKAIGFLMSGFAYTWPDSNISVVRILNTARCHITACIPNGPVSPGVKRLIYHLTNKMATQKYPLAKSVQLVSEYG